MKNGLVALVVFVVAAQASAQQLIHLVGDRFYQGTVLSSTADSVTARVKNAEGKDETHTVPASECDKYFFYQVRNKAIGDDAKARIELAKYCVDNEMFSRAKAQMDSARAADPAVVEKFMETEFPKIKEGLGQRLLEAGRRSLRRGSSKNAKWYASIILTKFEGTQAEAGAEQLLDEVQAKLDAKTAKKREQSRTVAAQKEARTEKQTDEARDKALAPIEKLLDEGQKADTRGLKAKNLSSAKSAFESAVTKYTRALKRAEQSLAATADESLKQALEGLRGEARQGAVQANLNLANTYWARGSHVQATKYANEALAIDPNNEEAKRTRASIAATGGGWARGRRR